MIMNKRMRAIYDTGERDAGTVSEELAQILDKGFAIVGGRTFLKVLYQKTTPVIGSCFVDDVGLECYVNHVHIAGDSCQTALQKALSFLEAIKLHWKSREGTEMLRTIVSLDEDGDCTFRCHIVRPGQSWLNENLDSYEETAILVEDIPDPSV